MTPVESFSFWQCLTSHITSPGALRFLLPVSDSAGSDSHSDSVKQLLSVLKE